MNKDIMSVIEKCITEKKNVIVNGLPEKSDSEGKAVFGRIVGFNKDCITFEIHSIYQDEKKENKKEVVYFTTRDISISFGTEKGLSDEEAEKEFGVKVASL